MERYQITRRDRKRTLEFLKLAPHEIDALDYVALITYRAALWNMQWALGKRADALMKPTKEELDALLKFRDEPED